MDKRELIIPTRFDHKDAAAGLKAIEQCGHAAGDLEHAADAASARFRKAQESVKSASEGYIELRRTLQGVADHEPRPTAGGVVANEAGQAGEKNLTPREWRESMDEFRNHAGARFGGSLTNSPGEQPGEVRDKSSPPSMTLGGLPQEAAASTPGQAYLPTSGPSQEGPQNRTAFRGISEAKSRGLGGESSLADGLRRAEQARILADGQHREALGASFEKGEVLGDGDGRRGAVQGSAHAGAEPRESGWPGSSTRESPADFVGRANSGREGPQSWLTTPWRAGNTTADGTRQYDLQTVRDQAEARLKNEGASEGIEAREGIRRMRTSFPAAAPADGHLAEERTTGPRAGAGLSPGRRDTNLQLGGGANGGVIERLLREQNELIKQDLQRNVSPPIAAPPRCAEGGSGWGASDRPRRDGPLPIAGDVPASMRLPVRAVPKFARSSTPGPDSQILTIPSGEPAALSK
jgi:hypothetical protein